MTTRDLTPQEAAALTQDLQEVLKKHGCELGVTSNITLMKYLEPTKEPIPSSIQLDDNKGDKTKA